MRLSPILIAAFAASAWMPAIGVTGGEQGNQLVAQEECLSAPNAKCIAELVIPAVKSNDSPSTHLQAIAEELLLRGERNYAEQLLKAAIDIGFEGFSTKTGFGANSDLWTVSRIGRLLTFLEEHGFRELQLDVVDLLEGFLERAEQSNAKEDALYLVFTTFNNIGAFEQALATVTRMSDPGNTGNRWVRFGDVAVAYSEAGRVDKALETLKRIGNPTFRGKAKARIAAALADQGRIELAIDILPRAFSDIEAIKAHKAVARALVRSGQVDDAISYVNSLSGKFARAFVQDSTSGALAEAGELEKALDLAKSISVRQQRAQAMATVGEILVARGDLEQARDVLAEMPRFPIWDDPLEETVEEARARLTRAIDAATKR